MLPVTVMLPARIKPPLTFNAATVGPLIVTPPLIVPPAELNLVLELSYADCATMAAEFAVV